MILFAMSVSECNTASPEHVRVSLQYACRYLDPFPNEDINTFFVIVLDIICSTTNRSYLVRSSSTANIAISTVSIVYVAICFPAKLVTPPVFDWSGFPYSKSYLIAHQKIGYLTNICALPSLS